ncbi:MAG: hypothetical protein JWR22_494 [Herminiimonas sp.]|nr:hypothetical protein [Herminiimonas sp.]
MSRIYARIAAQKRRLGFGLITGLQCPSRHPLLFAWGVLHRIARYKKTATYFFNQHCIH